MTKIFTERLVVRSLNRCDIDDVYDIMSDVETARDADFAPIQSLKEAESIIRHSDDFCYKVYGICEKGSDKVIGLIQAVRPWWNRYGFEAYVGYLLNRDYRHRGYMSEAFDALCKELFDVHFYKLYLTILPTNEASLGVARKVGFTYVEEEEEQKELQCTDLRPLDTYWLTDRMWYERHGYKAAA